MIMVKSSNGNLSRYVRHVMKQKGLTLRDIEVRSDGKITDGYAADILRGAASNPSAEKIKALACGLGVDAHALFDVVCGPFEERTEEPSGEGISDTVIFLELMQEVAESPGLTRILLETIQLEPEERAVVLKSLESINEPKRKRQRGKKSPRPRK